MAHGGARNGAGRKPGSTTTKTRDIADKAATEGVTPLEFMLAVMRDEFAERNERLDMAKAAAPYIHPRLSSVEAKVDANVRRSVRKIERVIIDPQAPDA
jgi:hypothetical protein